MVIGVFISVAVLLVIFGGLLAAADAALTVLSRSDLVDISSTSRSRNSLLAISRDPGAHVNALNFMRIVAETTAAVLVTLAFAYILDWWWALLFSALIMTAASFVPCERSSSDAYCGAHRASGARDSRTDRRCPCRAR
jgi:CBS domain containing-hemolysin-like protein